ncbi:MULTISPECIES: lipase secretion chaperone [unclassified Alcanivorax]|jgi:lipase chaperone LimK|uniref:lipase secretion chaperone n=1 Tax=unclassified Alcanivorax TaxID=2638842 RepID=UPI00017ED699|nr:MULTISPECIES: lipase secretion chaperone [unclassified Alcanivorax]EDX89502.1 Proteobacterial lipase chaperone protein [Alcanivorax sp. DG881]
MTRTLALLATVVVLATGVFWGLKRIPVPQHHAEPIPHQTDTQTNTSRGPDIATARITKPTLADTLANTSLAGTQVPGNLMTDARGHLIVDSNSKAIMDYFLALNGEMPDAAIRKALAQWAEQNAGTIAAADLLALLDRYQHYRSEFASGDYAARYAGHGDDDIRHKLQLRQQLRADTLGADTANALFADEDRYDQFSLNRHDIMTSDRSDEEKAAALRALRNTLPETLAKQYQQQYDLQHLPAREQSMKQQGANAAELYAFRQQQFGEAAAMRLQKLEEQRLAWQNRYQNYTQQRDRIHNAALSSDDKQKQLDALRRRLFSASEQQRAAALDRLQ